MRFISVLAMCAMPALLAFGCANDSVVQTGTIDVKVADNVDFTEFRTFSVVTSDLVETPPEIPELGEEQQAFNRQVNQLIIDAMRAEPVCLEYIPADEVTEENQPDLWAANGLGRSSDDGYVYECCGGWWWGYWGWYWDPCAYWCPVYVEYEVVSLVVPVGLPPSGDFSPDTPQIVFAGLAQALLGTGTPTTEQINIAIDEIFSQWPDPRTCSQ